MRPLPGQRVMGVRIDIDQPHCSSIALMPMMPAGVPPTPSSTRSRLWVVKLWPTTTMSWRVKRW